MLIGRLKLRKNLMKKFLKYFSGGCLKLKLRFTEKDKVKKNVGVVMSLSWASC